MVYQQGRRRGSAEASQPLPIFVGELREAGQDVEVHPFRGRSVSDIKRRLFRFAALAEWRWEAWRRVGRGRRKEPMVGGGDAYEAPPEAQTANAFLAPCALWCRQDVPPGNRGDRSVADGRRLPTSKPTCASKCNTPTLVSQSSLRQKIRDGC